MADFIGISFRLEEEEKMLVDIQIGINRSCILKYYNHAQNRAAIIGYHLAKNLQVSSTNAWRINNLITGVGLLLFNANSQIPSTFHFELERQKSTAFIICRDPAKFISLEVYGKYDVILALFFIYWL
jgi:hypothetical protein